ncbi:MAG TPA: nucleotidyltransferase family protein [Thermoanaerobaculia bacterium]|nr:nucleotidyltransferase family protein [Thermoanaerobaculia bacterium]
MERVATKSEVLEVLTAERSRLRELGVADLRIFGSFARDEAGPESDLDVLVRFAAGRKSYDTFLDLSELLEEVTGRPVELLTREGLSPHLGPLILEESVDVPLD